MRACTRLVLAMCSVCTCTCAYQLRIETRVCGCFRRLGFLCGSAPSSHGEHPLVLGQARGDPTLLAVARALPIDDTPPGSLRPKASAATAKEPRNSRDALAASRRHPLRPSVAPTTIGWLDLNKKRRPHSIPKQMCAGLEPGRARLKIQSRMARQGSVHSRLRRRLGRIERTVR
jgi:hypothetical protein